MKELLKNVLDSIVAVAKSLKDGETPAAIETLEKTATDLTKQIEETEEETPEPETEAEAPAEGEETELKKTVDAAVQVELKKWAELYLTADSAQSLIDEVKTLSGSVGTLTKALETKDAEIEVLKSKLEAVEKIQAEVSSKQDVEKAAKDVFAGVFI